jgi:hydrogenase nickel incorporation protein HypB
MCATCGCGQEEHHHHHDHDHHHDHPHRVTLEADLLEKNRALAEKNRAWLAERKIRALNLMSSPGAGKTTLIERMLRDRGPLAVIEGDQATRNDAERIRAAGGKAVQINTGAGCHLDAAMVQHALGELAPPPSSLLLIENVGNLVCPAMFDLGEAERVVIASVTEGDDKPVKYPHMFRAADVIVLNKMDLLPHVSFDVERFCAQARRVRPGVRIFPLSATRGDGLADWYGWLDA